MTFQIRNLHVWWVVNLQGSGHMLYDPEIATAQTLDSDEEFLFCAGNLNVLAMATFVKAHLCHKFCPLLGLKQLISKNLKLKRLGKARFYNLI